ALLLLATAALTAACGGKASNGATSSPSPSQARPTSASLLSYAVRGSDLGPGWTDSPTPNGTSVAIDNGNHPCHKDYPSDYERYAKNSVTIVNAQLPSQVQDDVVYYVYHGATDALKEIRAAVTTCSSYTEVNSEGATITIDVHISTATSSAVGDDRVIFDRRATLGGRSIYSVVFVVRVGTYVSTIFTLSGDPAEAGRLAGLASVAAANRLKTAPS
ncbi:MAG TPA: hypothetical protein VM674_06300, partial [Candidatus Acidoferrum sp.]|nr:hypothetical protein [Candidatus Acidoferrum sp.]